MKKQIKALILGVGGNVSQGIVKALRGSGLDIVLLGACISEYSAGLYLCDKAFLAPYASDAAFLPWLVSICNEEAVDIVLTGVEENINAIMKQYDCFTAQTSAIFCSVSYAQLTIGQDKYLTCQWLKEHGCNYPKYCLLSDAAAVAGLVKEAGFPLIAKPRHGKGAKGIVKITAEEDFVQIAQKEDYVLEECIGTDGDEYTVGCYCDKEQKFRGAIIMHRRLVNGSTDFARIVENEAILEEAEKICAAFCPAGPLNIQLRIDKHGRPVCFELNVRFSGTAPIRAHFGYEDVKAMVKEYVLGEAIDDCFHVQKGEAYRYVNEIYTKEGCAAQMQKEGVLSDPGAFFPRIETLGNWKNQG